MSASPTAEGYRWLTSVAHAHWVEIGYCFTYLSDSVPGEVLDALEAEERSTITGLDDLHIRAGDAWDERGGGPFGRTLVAATAVGAGTLLAESNGFIGVTEALMKPLSRGREIVANYYAVGGRYQFLWWIDGQLKLGFDPLGPGINRFGAEPDDHVEEMRAAGLDVDMGRDITEVPINEATFAFAERITHVRITPALLGEASYELGLVQNAH